MRVQFTSRKQASGIAHVEMEAPTYVVSDSGYAVNVDPMLESDDQDDSTYAHVASVLEYIRKKVTHSTVY
ncbi:hypothetical protein [Enterovibrio norvegicus]|uniref:hypothetical protein n=1 Tax=Enterovibrio norvegicus TaxID=188144 RepID=UPI000C81818D|nr:hypothetical protein [Enterovibrio norvegicus]PML81963.1 hypothetical protein BCT69_01080 [Enterovibrio norvegicus]PMN72254.1 hypothetical protein BCT27_15535 [Enterovibrio norvegicus]